MKPAFLPIEPLRAKAFTPFGDVIEATGTPDLLINGGNCARYTDRARLDFAPQGRAGISIFRGKPYALPLKLHLVERHPLGSQAFLPLSGDPFLVIVAPDAPGCPGTPRAFRTAPGQGVNILRGIWHGVLCPVGRCALFAVIDYIGPGPNLEEHHFDTPGDVGTTADVEHFAATPGANPQLSE